MVRVGTQVQGTSKQVPTVRVITKYANLIIHSVVRDSHWGVLLKLRLCFICWLDSLSPV